MQVLGRPKKGTSPLDRFWSRVRKTRTCWLWTGYSKNGRYGHLQWGKGVERPAHVVSWEIHNGPVPEGMKVLHKCDVPKCVKPKHLFLGTMADNMQDMHRKGRGPDRSAIATAQWARRRAL